MHSPASARERGLIGRATMALLVGLFVLSSLGVTLVTVAVNRISDSTDSLRHSQIMIDYAGRPEPVLGATGIPAVNYLVMATSGDSLKAVVLANLSASRRDLTLITMPADLKVASNPTQTLGSSFAIDPAITVRALEAYTGTRLDHQVLLNLDGFGSAIDTLGGVYLNGTRLDGNAAVNQVLQTADSNQSATATGVLLRALLVGADQSFSALDPSRFSSVIDAVAPFVEVDTDLTGTTFRTMILESSVHPIETRIWPLSSSDGSHPTAALLESDARQALRIGLSAADLTHTAQYRQAAYLPQGANR